MPQFKLTAKDHGTYLFVVLAFLATITPGATNLLRLEAIGPINCLNPRWYLGVVGHVFAHQGLIHWAGNMALFLLLAPAIERKLGALRFLFTLLGLTLLTGLSEALVLTFTRTAVIGASGLVFAFILLTTFTESRKGEIPLSSLAVAMLWGTKELGGLFTPDTVANSAHLAGALWGFIWGWKFLPKEEPPATLTGEPCSGKTTRPTIS